MEEKAKRWIEVWPLGHTRPRYWDPVMNCVVYKRPNKDEISDWVMHVSNSSKRSFFVHRDTVRIKNIRNTHLNNIQNIQIHPGRENMDIGWELHSTHGELQTVVSYHTS